MTPRTCLHCNCVETDHKDHDEVRYPTGRCRSRVCDCPGFEAAPPVPVPDKLSDHEQSAFLEAKRQDPDGLTKTVPWCKWISLMDELDQLRAERDLRLAKEAGA